MTVKTTVKDVHFREVALKSHDNIPIMKSILYENAIDSISIPIIENAINNWRLLDVNEHIAMEKAIDLFEHATEFCPVGTLNKLANTIAESSISKVRDGSQTAAYIKRKLSRFKTKLHTKTSKKIKQAREFKLPKAKLPDPVKNGIGNNKQQQASESQIEDAYNIILDKALVIEQCDRIIRNDKKLSKRFNLDKLAYHAETVEDFTLEACSLLDTYDIPYYAKYSLALENCMYTLYKNNIKFDSKDILEAATTYYLMKDLDDNYISGIAKVLTENKMIKESDLLSVDYLLHPNDKLIMESMDNILDSISYSSTMSNSLLEYSGLDYTSILEAKVKKNQVKDLIDNFKLLPKKSVEAMHKLINKIFTKSEKEIIDEIPSFFTLLRTFFVISTFGINPVLGLLTAFTNHLLGMHFNRKEMPKVIEKYKQEIKKVNKQLENATGEKKERLEKYKHGLEYGERKLTEHYDAIRTEKEKDADFESDDEDFELDFNESVISLAKDLAIINYLAESIDLSIFDDCKFNTEYCVSIDPSILDSFADCAGKVIVDQSIRNKVSEAFSNEYNRIKSSKSSNRYMYLEYARIAKNIFEESKPVLNYDDLNFNINHLYTLYEMTNEFVNVLSESVEVSKYVTEDTSVSNKLKLAGEKLKKSAANLSDKDKMVSKQIDGSMASLQRSIEKALTTDNRESVIKGSIVPSASKAIKLAITGGAAWMLNPVLAIIGAIGYLACSKKLQSKERQILLDEINIELEMCEKYLKIAEEKDDMKATRELLQIQKRLQREKSRILHASSYNYNDRIDTGTSDRD